MSYSVQEVADNNWINYPSDDYGRLDKFLTNREIALRKENRHTDPYFQRQTKPCDYIIFLHKCISHCCYTGDKDISDKLYTEIYSLDTFANSYPDVMVRDYDIYDF